jgi:hypothetical protein
MLIALAAASIFEPTAFERLEMEGPGYRQTQTVISLKEPRGGELRIGCINQVKNTFKIQFIPQEKTNWWEKFRLKHIKKGDRTWLGYNFDDDRPERGIGYFSDKAFLIDDLFKGSAYRAKFLDQLSKQSHLHFQYGDPTGLTYKVNFSYRPDRVAIRDIVQVCQPKKVMQIMREQGWQFDGVAE